MNRVPKWFLRAVAAVIIVIIAALVLLRMFVFVVSGGSMLPTYKSYDFGFVNMFDRKFSRKEVVIYQLPDNSKKFYIARVIGLPSEYVEIKKGDVYINGEVLDEREYWSDESVTHGDVSVFLTDDQYYLLGDNRVTALDSRTRGPISLQNIRGTFAHLSFIR